MSAATADRLQRVFPGKNRAEAEALLVQECAEGLPLADRAGPAELERIRFAVLKLSAGRIDRLSDAIVQAKTDWRDLLMAAGFGADVDAHLRWQPDVPPVQ